MISRLSVDASHLPKQMCIFTANRVTDFRMHNGDDLRKMNAAVARTVIPWPSSCKARQPLIVDGCLGSGGEH
jgi:hypothetical protein